MAQSQFSVSWEAYPTNICNGLSALQQNGDFVDMTLAADGHFVKVHQVIMALASPFIKDILGSMSCTHPVIFLNKISYTTLSSILEYVYTGEVLVSIENLSELIQAGRELHIKGLEDMLHPNLPSNQRLLVNNTTVDAMDEEICYFEISEPKSVDANSNASDSLCPLKLEEVTVEERLDDTEEKFNNDCNISMSRLCSEKADVGSKKLDTNNVMSVMQYTVSNQGSLQMILNRFVYYLKHTNRNSTRQWRCVDYVSGVKCPAHVVTKGDVVLQRISVHTHPFHDKKILKKVQSGAIFSAITEAEREGKEKRRANDTNVDSNASK
ncbi:GDNF-inducible zinc finger protein 1-like isoform X2 [Galleria mellonella]|uniref:GDNF-inducible zinc finger protein 1-like isoform X2 n=1 Tax=Galleria mellonella TaxID=7137 RepID=A0ABM3MTS7_GALME|nr:GDNF-inducible zinc finger protein 1-like isoform X2 [Galleria mellonella]